MQQLIEWKNRPNRKPLVIKGARQVGKTWIMKELGAKCFKKVAYISFYNNPFMKEIIFQEEQTQPIFVQPKQMKKTLSSFKKNRKTTKRQ